MRQGFYLVSRKIWLLNLVLPFRYGRLLTGILLLSLLFPFFYLGREEVAEDSTPALFFSLISLESGFNLAESLPGAIATLVPLLILFFIPVWPVHRRLVRMKERELVALNDRIEACPNAAGEVDLETQRFDQLLPLLIYRREIVQVSTWPFDVGNMTRLAFYLIIPPLTWAGAALIENVVDSLL